MPINSNCASTSSLTSQTARLRHGAGRRDHIAEMFSAIIVPGRLALRLCLGDKPRRVQIPEACPAFPSLLVQSSRSMLSVASLAAASKRARSPAGLTGRPDTTALAHST